MSKEAYDKIAEGLNEALSVVTKPIEPDANAELVRYSLEVFNTDGTGKIIENPQGKYVSYSDHLALIQQLTAERDAALSVHRWNVDDQGNGTLYVCKNNHDKGDPCEWIKFVEAEAAEQRVKELETALANDKDESLWRFWNNKARELTVQAATMREALEHIDGLLKSKGYSEDDPLARGMIRTALKGSGQ